VPRHGSHLRGRRSSLCASRIGGHWPPREIVYNPHRAVSTIDSRPSARCTPWKPWRPACSDGSARPCHSFATAIPQPCPSPWRSPATPLPQPCHSHVTGQRGDRPTDSRWV
jgi:hypothetical protein